MPLNPAALTSSPGLPGAAGADYPTTRAECAQAWAAAVGDWAAAIVPASTTVSAAQSTLEAALLGAFGGPDAATVATAMDAAFLAFATTLAGGMAGAGFAGVPPPAPVGFAALFATPAATRVDGVAKVATRLQAWMITGTATLIAPPNTPIIWS